ncbi:extracellular solute-binding protein [Minwuia sp.]|uniref:extracellular solute-binding protein n=1 Tax=Minwuia sp. TaxID=2493630 RepID=UPI003A944558
MHGTPKYPPDFEHFDYVNPDAPRTGTLSLAARQGGYDSLNPFIFKGQAAEGWRLVFESLTKRAQDEPFSLYGLLAEEVEMDPARKWIRFRLREGARFADGEPVKVSDLIWSWETLRDKGRPNHRLYYREVLRTEVDGRDVTFRFRSGDNLELPLLMALMPVLPAHWFEANGFEKTTLDPIPGSGPYRVDRVEQGRRIEYVRREDYWGRDLPVNRGDHNFERIHYEFFRDGTAGFEALKGGMYDVHFEDDPGRWEQAYDFPAMRDGRLTRLTLPMKRPAGMRGFVMNSRRAPFDDIRVRRALNLAFDFDWANENLFFNAYRRNESYYQNSDLMADGPPSDTERALLEPFAETLPDGTLGPAVLPPATPGPKAVRANLKAALGLFGEAGWNIGEGRKLRDATGTAMRFEILLFDPGDEALSLHFARTLERLGIDVSVRSIDPAQYERRRQSFEFDLIINHWYQSLSPGSEQWYYWGKAQADNPGSRNYAGVRLDAVDAMIGHMTAATTRSELQSATRSLDRILRAGRYVVPLYWQPEQRMIVAKGLTAPAVSPIYGPVLTTWWWDR